MRLALFSLLFLLVLAVPAAAAESITSVYVISRPEITVSLAQTDGSLLCSWNITDLDEGDKFAADVLWIKDGKNYSAESVDCGTEKYCAASQRPVPAVGEAWKCSAIVRDGYGSVGIGSSSEFELTPLSFFGGLLRAVFSFFNLA